MAVKNVLQTQLTDELEYFIARQPVFTVDGVLWGFELLFRDTGTTHAAIIHNPTAATAEIITDGIALALSGAASRRKVMIPISSALLATNILEALPRHTCVLVMLEDVTPNPAVMDRLHRLKRLGYTLALDNYTHNTGQEILALVNIVKVDFMAVPAHLRPALTQSIRHNDHILLAKNVDTFHDAQHARDLGYSLLQGCYFQHPKLHIGHTVAPTLSTKIRAMTLLSRAELDKNTLLQVFALNPQLTYRLMRFVNSAAFGKTAKLKSLEHIFTYLGSDPLRRWLMAMLLADGHTTDSQKEMAFLGAVRAHFLQNMASSLGQGDADTLFMLGLFSLLDAIYETPFGDLMQNVPLDADVKAALCGGTGILPPWLRIARCMERGDIATATAHMRAVGATESAAESATLSADYRKALAWARTALH